MPYDDIVMEALAHGWIDSLPRRLDAARTMVRLSPRRLGSAWSGVNKRRIAELEQLGQMTDAGRAAVEAAKADGSWTLLDDASALRVPPDLAESLAAGSATTDWDRLPPSRRRSLLEAIALAKRSDTRARRVDSALAAARRPVGSA